MNTNTTDVVIHTANILNDAQFSEVASQIKTIEGVMRFDRSEYKPKFIMVAYNAGQTKALNILNKFNRLGFNASLIGM